MQASAGGRVQYRTGTCVPPAPQDHAGGSQGSTGTKSQKWETPNTSNRGLRNESRQIRPTAPHATQGHREHSMTRGSLQELGGEATSSVLSERACACVRGSAVRGQGPSLAAKTTGCARAGERDVHAVSRYPICSWDRRLPLSRQGQMCFDSRGSWPSPS